MEDGPADEDGPIIADAADPIAPRPMEAMKAVGPIGPAETVGETMAEAAIAVETGVRMETAIAMETTEAVESAEVVEAAMMIDVGLGGCRGRHGSACERERYGAGRNGGFESDRGEIVLALGLW